MWYFKIKCVAGFWACLFVPVETNRYMAAKTEAECYESANNVAAYRQLIAGKYEAECYKIELAKPKQ